MSILSPSCSGAGRCDRGRGEQLGAVSASIAPARISTEFLIEPLTCLLSSSLISEGVSPSAQVIEVSFMGLRVQYPILAKSPARGNINLGCRKQEAQLPLKIQYNPLLVLYRQQCVSEWCVWVIDLSFNLCPLFYSHNFISQVLWQIEKYDSISMHRKFFLCQFPKEDEWLVTQSVSSPSSLITCIIQNLLCPSNQRISSVSTEVQMLSNK